MRLPSHRTRRVRGNACVVVWCCEARSFALIDHCHALALSFVPVICASEQRRSAVPTNQRHTQLTNSPAAAQKIQKIPACEAGTHPAGIPVPTTWPPPPPPAARKPPGMS